MLDAMYQSNYCLPTHVTALYVFAVVNLTILVNLTLVNAEIVIRGRHNETLRNGIADLPANFGPAIARRGVWGHVVMVNPNDACSRVESPPNFPLNETSGIGNRWIALIKRGNCDFDVKVWNAQNASYAAVIVHNVNHSNTLIAMNSHTKTDIRIPSTFIGYRDGVSLETFYSGRPYINAVIERDEVFTYHYAMFVMAVFGCVIGICFMSMVALAVIRWFRNARRRSRARLSRTNLQRIPVHKFKKGDPYDLCAICLEDYEDGEKLRVLPCRHAYHMKCIDPWLTKNKKTCPICKQRVVPGGERHDESASESETESESDGDYGGGAAAAPAAAAENTPLLGNISARGRGGNSRAASAMTSSSRRAPRGSRRGNASAAGRRSGHQSSRISARGRADTFDRSGVPEVFRPPSSRSNRRSSTDSSDDGGGAAAAYAGRSVTVSQSSVEVHSEPDFARRVRPPKRRADANSRRIMPDAERPLTAPIEQQVRPPPTGRAWEFAHTPTDAERVLGAVPTDTSDVPSLDIDDVAPRRQQHTVPASSAHAVEASTSNEADDVASAAAYGGARPKRRPRASNDGALLLVHHQPISSQDTDGVTSKSTVGQNPNDAASSARRQGKKKSSRQQRNIDVTPPSDDVASGAVNVFDDTDYGKVIPTTSHQDGRRRSTHSADENESETGQFPTVLQVENETGGEANACAAATSDSLAVGTVNDDEDDEFCVGDDVRILPEASASRGSRNSKKRSKKRSRDDPEA